MSFQGFGPGAVRFYEELAANNNRQWWQASRGWYESDVRAPLEHLLADLADEFGEARVFRPNRDTRFSRDKSPYKTVAAAVIGTVPGGASTLYVQLSADGLLVGAGCYHPMRDQLARMRAAVADERAGSDLEKVVADLGQAGARLEAPDRLKTAPRGYPADHPRIDLLRMKGMVAMAEHPAGPWLQDPEVQDTVASAWRTFRPLNAWLEDHVGPSELPLAER